MGRLSSMVLNVSDQPQGQVQVLFNILRGFTAQAALDAPRFCVSSGSLDNELEEGSEAGDGNSEVFFEEGISKETVAKLQGRIDVFIVELILTFVRVKQWDTILAGLAALHEG